MKECLSFIIGFLLSFLISIEIFEKFISDYEKGELFYVNGKIYKIVEIKAQGENK